MGGEVAAVLSPELLVALAGAVGAVLGGVGGILSAFFLARKAAREDAQQLIDQLQEERTAFVGQLEAERAQMRAERAEHDARVDKFWADKAASRQHVAQLEQHIWARKEPPPPTPPAGYIP